MEIRGLSCCGLKELAGIGCNRGPLDVMQELTNQDWNGAFRRFGYIFSEAYCSGERLGLYGTSLADYIKENKLGNVTELPTFRNPNSGNMIRTFFWIPNVPKVKALVKAKSKRKVI